MSTFGKGAALGVALLAMAAAAIPSNNAKQVVFSTPGFTMNLSNNTKASSTDFGFWVWCSAPSGSNGAYLGACNGSLYFYALGAQATPVVGFVTPNGNGVYTMSLFQGTFAEFLHGKLNPQYVCSLSNTAAPGEVLASCSFSAGLGGGSGSADVTNAVVIITGP